MIMHIYYPGLDKTDTAFCNFPKVQIEYIHVCIEWADMCACNDEVNDL